MILCKFIDRIYINLPDFFPCKAKDLPAKMAALSAYVRHVEKIQARYCQRIKKATDKQPVA